MKTTKKMNQLILGLLFGVVFGFLLQKGASQNITFCSACCY